MDTRHPKDRAKLIGEYYDDLDRANRTPREVLYLHLGMLVGAVIGMRKRWDGPTTH